VTPVHSRLRRRALLGRAAAGALLLLLPVTAVACGSDDNPANNGRSDADCARQPSTDDEATSGQQDVKPSEPSRGTAAGPTSTSEGLRGPGSGDCPTEPDDDITDDGGTGSGG
jgi:hypothetical protein